MNEFQNGEMFPVGGIHQASSMYLADAAELGRFDAGRLLTLEKEWQAKFQQLPINDEVFSFCTALRVFEGLNGKLTFIYSPSADCFVLLGFVLKPSTRGSGNVITLNLSACHPTLVRPMNYHRDVAVGAVAAVGSPPPFGTTYSHDNMSRTMLKSWVDERSNATHSLRALLEGLPADPLRLHNLQRDLARQLLEQGDLEIRLAEEQARLCIAAQAKANQVRHDAVTALRRSRIFTTALFTIAGIALAAASVFIRTDNINTINLTTAGLFTLIAALLALRTAGPLSDLRSKLSCVALWWEHRLTSQMTGIRHLAGRLRGHLPRS